MVPVDSENTTPVSAVSTRRLFMSKAAGVAAATVFVAVSDVDAKLAFTSVSLPAFALAAAGAPEGPQDPIYGVIAGHRAASLAHYDAIDEGERLEALGDPLGYSWSEKACHAECGAFQGLIGTAPTTVPGLITWVAYLNELCGVDAWRFQDMQDASTILVATLATALSNLGVVA